MFPFVLKLIYLYYQVDSLQSPLTLPAMQDTEMIAKDRQSPSDETSMQAFTNALDTFGEFYPTGPMCWGPVQWAAMHQMARGFPLHNPSPEKQAAVKAYMLALVEVLPCSICATHWKNIAPTVDTSSRNAFLKWTIDVHNSVNKRTEKTVLSYRDAIEAIVLQCTGNRLTLCSGNGSAPGQSSNSTSTTSQSPISAVTTLAATSILFAFAMIVFFVLFMHARRRASK